MKPIFSSDQLDILSLKVRKLLKTAGFLVHHGELSAILKKKGLKQSVSGRFLFEDSLMNEFVDHEILRRKNAQPPETAGGSIPAKPFRTWFGNMAPKFYDYSTQTIQSAKTEHLAMLARFGHQEEKIENITLPFFVTDIPQRTAPLESAMIMFKLTDKNYYSIDSYSAELVKYMVELSDVFLGAGKVNQFIDPCNCINPILRLEERTAGVMMERAKYHLDFLMTSMPTAGGTAPVTLDGSVIQGAAEVAGGLIIAYLLNPDNKRTGYISSSVMDLKTVTTTQSSPETVLIDCGVVQLMEHAFGGNTLIGGRSFITARRPGLQAVFERMFKATAYQQYMGTFMYGGNGTLDNGSLLCPEQLLVDMDITEAFHRLQPVKVRDESIEDLIARVSESQSSDFLTADHTLENFRGTFWEPALFTRGETRSEKEILDNAHQRFRNKVEQYRGYDYDRTKMKAAEEILSRAKKELL